MNSQLMHTKKLRIKETLLKLGNQMAKEHVRELKRNWLSWILEVKENFLFTKGGWELK